MTSHHCLTIATKSDVRSVSFSPDGMMVAAVSNSDSAGGSILLCCSKSGGLLADLKHPNYRGEIEAPFDMHFSSVAFSPDQALQWYA